MCSRQSLRRCQDLHRRFQTTSSCVQDRKHILSWKCSVDFLCQLLLFCLWALGKRGTLLQTEVSSHLFLFRTSQLPIWVEDFKCRFAVTLWSRIFRKSKKLLEWLTLLLSPETLAMTSYYWQLVLESINKLVN